MPKRKKEERGINTSTLVADEMRTILSFHNDYRGKLFGIKGNDENTNEPTRAILVDSKTERFFLRLLLSSLSTSPL